MLHLRVTYLALLRFFYDFLENVLSTFGYLREATFSLYSSYFRSLLHQQFFIQFFAHAHNDPLYFQYGLFFHKYLSVENMDFVT